MLEIERGETCLELLVSDIEKKLERLGPPISPDCCIYRVPGKLRKLNEAAYTPYVVSIGPLHYRKRTLKNMEKHKLRYLKNFLDGSVTTKLKDFICFIKTNETRIRQCYAETFDHLCSDVFVKMVLVDAAFVIEFFLKISGVKPKADFDFILHQPWMRVYINQDLLLLENQLPFFVLEGLYELAFASCPISVISFPQVAHQYFMCYNKQNKPIQKDVKHFTDLLRNYQLPCSPHTHSSTSPIALILPPSRKTRYKSLPNEHLYSATELNNAGVTFKVSTSNCLLDIKFTDDGNLEIPCLELYDSTEPFFRNLMALEHCEYYPIQTIICDYFLLMDYLINTTKDVELLVQKKIIINWLGNYQEAANVVNRLGLQILERKDGYYSRLIEKLNAYYENPYHSRRAVLKREYFENPWRGASTIAAIILLVLTLIQTICSIMLL